MHCFVVGLSAVFCSGLTWSDRRAARTPLSCREARLVTSLGYQKRRVYWEGPKFFKLYSIVLNYVEHIFLGGRKFFRGCFAPPATPRYGPARSDSLFDSWYVMCQTLIFGKIVVFMRWVLANFYKPWNCVAAQTRLMRVK